MKQSDRDSIVETMRTERVSFKVACQLTGTDVREATRDRMRGLFTTGHEAGLAFDTAVVQIDAERIGNAERTLFELSSGERQVGETRAEARSANTQLHAAKLLLEKLYPEKYGTRRADEVTRMKNDFALELLEALREKLSTRAYDEVLHVLSDPLIADEALFRPELETGDEK
jgi:hypothetical protein